MLTKTKIALAIALIAGSASVASAQGFDPNPANRYQTYAAPGGMAQPYNGTAQGHVSRNVASQNVAPRTLQSAPVSLYQGRNLARAGGQIGTYGAQQDEIGIDLQDRASAPYAGGVN
jgi:hypothetical protein